MLQAGDNIVIEGGRGLRLGPVLASGRGGEGMVFEVPIDGMVAKIYHQQPPPNTVAKLAFMIAHPPDDPERERGHASIAWPVSLARRNGQVVGFLMPRAPRGKQLVELLSPRDRKRWVPDFTWQGMLLAGRNLARAFQHIHATGYVIGDVKPENIHVTDQSLITILDTDSFQVQDPIRRVIYPCGVCTPGYTAPELLINGIHGKARQPEQDAFALGVIAYKLLTATDAHPFQGVWCGPGDAPDNDDELVRNGWYTHKPGSFMRPNPRVLPPAALPPQLAGLLDRCFVLGHQSPTSRPGPGIGSQRSTAW